MAKTESKPKKTKVEKKVSAKKLPSLLKKSYTEKAFDKKILSKIYVPSDKTYVEGLFKKTKDKKGNPVLAVPAETEFTKKELKRLKVLANDIKHNKGRIKLASFIAVAAILVAVGLTVTVFKNPVAKWGIRSAMQGIFGAKCDIGSVNIEFWNSRLTVTNLAQSSSSDYMKNIFQFDKLDLKFNLSQLLRAKFDAENIEIIGIETNTERTVSGELPIKPKTARQKEEKNDSTGFYDSLKEKCGTDTDAAKNAFVELFALYNPQNITANIQENLQSQKVAKEVEEEMKTLVEAWKNKPEELKSTVNDLKSKTSKLTSLNVSSVKNATEVTALLKELDSAFSEVKSAKSSINSTLGSFDSDQAKVKELQKKLTDAVEADQKLLSSQLSVLDVAKSRELITSAINDAGYAMLGQYYPYLKQLISYAGSMKGSGDSKSEEAKAANKKAKETAKKESKRFAGRYVYWKADRVPKFLIEKAHGSGKGLDISATDISSDMNKRGSPWIVKGSYNQEKRVHNAGLVVDARTNSNAPLITGDYSGNNFPLTLDLEKNISANGMPKFEGASAISAKLTADSDFSFSGSGSLNMNPAVVTASSVGSETADRIYSTALASIKNLDVSAKVAFSSEKGIDMNISTDFDKLLSNAISSVAAKEMENVKNDAMAKVNEKLGSSSENANAYFAKFDEISSSINSSKSALDSINSQLESKKSELQKKATSTAASAATNAVSDKAASGLKGLLKK